MRRRKPYRKHRTSDVVTHAADRPDLHDLAERLRERDERTDDRTPGQRALGDPPSWRSARAPVAMIAPRTKPSEAAIEIDKYQVTIVSIDPSCGH